MIQITINNNSYDFPQEWKDISLKQFIKYLKEVQPTEPPKYKAIIEAKTQEDKLKLIKEITDVEYDADFLPYFARVISSLSAAPYSLLLNCQKSQVEKLYYMLKDILCNVTSKYQKHYKLAGESYEIASKHMKNGTLGEYAETAQMLRFIEKQEGNHLLALPKVLCILVRKKGENFSDEVFKRERLFLSFDMQSVWNVFFFIQKQAKVYEQAIQIFLNNQTGRQ